MDSSESSEDEAEDGNSKEEVEELTKTLNDLLRENKELEVITFSQEFNGERI